MPGKCTICNGDHYAGPDCPERIEKTKPEVDKVYILRTYPRGQMVDIGDVRFDVVEAVFDHKGAHRHWRSLVDRAVRTAWEDDTYIEVPEGKWSQVLLEPFS